MADQPLSPREVAAEQVRALQAIRAAEAETAARWPNVGPPQNVAAGRVIALDAAIAALSAPTATPAAKWREEGKPDPHGSTYDCERAALVMGDYTDDELANAVHLHCSGHGIESLALPIAAKDRIRWLSRALVKQKQEQERAQSELASVAELIEAIKENREATQAFANDGQPANWARYEASEARIVAALAKAPQP